MEEIKKLLEDQQKQMERIEQLLLVQKTVLTLSEVASYTGLSKSYLYKLTSGRKIPHHCPTGKVLFFSKEEIDQWLLSNKVSTVEEVEQEALNYLSNNKRRA